MVDANGNVVGTILAVAVRGTAQVAVASVLVQGVWKPVVLDMSQTQFFNIVGALYFEGASCSGTPLIEASAHHFLLEGAAFGPPGNVGTGALVYYPTETATPRQVASRSASYSPTDCQTLGGSFTAPYSCCLTDGAPSSRTVSPAAALDMGDFVPPFTVRVQ